MPRYASPSLALLASGCLRVLPEVEEPCEAWAEPGLFRVKLDRPDSSTRKPYVLQLE